MTADIAHATAEAVRHLIKLGHRRIAYVGQAALGEAHVNESHRIVEPWQRQTCLWMTVL